MTKKEIIKTIQNAEAKLDKELNECTLQFGYEGEYTQKMLARWAEVYGLLQELGIETKRG